MITLDLSILNQKGTPMFNSDTLANRPAAGIVGRIFIAIDAPYGIYRDTGSAWDQISGASTFSGSLATGQVAFGSATNTISGSNNLFWDAANERLGIGTNSLIHKLSVLGNVSIGNHITIGETTGTAGRVEFFNGNVFIRRSGGSGLEFAVNNQNVGQTIFSTGNVVIQTGGTIVDAGQRLQVYGDAFIKGSGNTGASNALSIQNSDGTALFQVTNGQIVLFNTARTLSGAMLLQSSGGGNTTGFTFGLLNPFTATSGSTYLITNASSFEPTSGTGTYTFLSARPTINQTGGANGITRGLHIAPTLTAAADWRSIEWNNGTGWGLYGEGSAPNYLGGNLGIGSVSVSSVNLRIARPITGGASTVAIYANGSIQALVTTSAEYFKTEVATAASNFNLLNLYHFSATQGTLSNISAGGSVTNQYGFAVNSFMVSATNNYGFYGDIPSGTNRWNIYMAGTALNHLGGSLGIKTSSLYSPSTFSLDVNGGLLVKNQTGITAQITLINANPALGGNNGFLVASVGGTSGGSYVDFQGYYGTSITGSTALRLNPAGGSVIVNSTTNTGEQFQVTGTLRVNGQSSGTAGILSGQYLIINLDGTTYKIALLNP